MPRANDPKRLLLKILDCGFDRASWHGPNLTSSLRGVHARLRQAIVDFPPGKLNDKMIWRIHGVAAHDVYHAGQIKLLRRLIDPTWRDLACLAVKVSENSFRPESIRRVFMSRTKIAVMLLVLFGLLSLYAPGQSETPTSSPPDATGPSPQWIVAPMPPPQTRLEAFAARKGIVIVKGYTRVGEISGDDGAMLRISAVEFSNAAKTPERQTGLAIQVNEGGRLGRSALCYIDADEIDGLLDAIAKLTQLQSTSTKLTDYDAGFRTNGELEVTNLSHNGTRMAGIRSVQVLFPSGQIATATAYLRLSRMQDLLQELTTAKQTLDKLGAPAEARK